MANINYYIIDQSMTANMQPVIYRCITQYSFHFLDEINVILISL